MYNDSDMINDYTVFRSGRFRSEHTNYISELVYMMPHIVLMGDELIDATWMRKNIVYDYMGIFYSTPENVPFYFADRLDATIFKLKYGGRSQ